MTRNRTLIRSPLPSPFQKLVGGCEPTERNVGQRAGSPKVTDQNQHHRNRLLAALRPRDFALLEPHLQIVPIARGEFLHLPGDEIDKVYFLHRGIVSLMAISEDGNAISTASVGSEGVDPPQLRS
jgi:hypothetical protein